MIPYLVLFVSLIVFWRLIRHDIAERDGVSSAIWIPTLWVGILLSRPISMWLDFGGADDYLEGSPLDRLFYFGLILASLAVLSRRRIVWSEVIARSWPILLFYLYLLVSVTWSPTPFVSFKRWFKDFGNIFIALVILTEVNPQQAFRAVFVRCAYVLIPLSVVFLRYFPELGRRYLRGGQLEVVGVTTQKNSLGILIVICGLVLIWDWFERTESVTRRRRLDRYLPVAFLAMGIYLLNLSDSKTSMLCFLFGGAVMLSPRIPVLKHRVGALGFLLLAAVLGYFVLDSVFQIKGALLGALGRDQTFTGRTEVWQALLALKTDPLFGTGFCNIWSNYQLLEQLPDWVGKSTHNGYLEMYIDGGYVCLFFLAIMILVIGQRLNRALVHGGHYSRLCFAVFVAMVLGNLSESHWGRMAPLGFIFLAIAIGHVHRVGGRETVHALAGNQTGLQDEAADSPVASDTTGTLPSPRSN